MGEMMESYRRAFEDLRVRHPGADTGPRQAALDAFLSHGFPTRALEDWKYTDLSALAKRAFTLPAGVPAPSAGSGLPGMRLLRFVDGVAQGAAPAEARHTGRSASWREPIDALNAAFALEGAQLHVAGGSAPPAWHVITEVTESSGAMVHLRHLIELDARAKATVLFEHRGTGDYLTTQVIEVHLSAGSQLELVCLQAEAPGATHLARVDAHVARDARLDYFQVDAGGGLVRHDVNVHLDAPGAHAEMHGSYATFGREHHDTHTRIVHAAPHGTSRETFRGVVGDRARAVFNGLIRVEVGASKTDSEQSVRNLLLSPRAEVNAKPELEIYNDDVRCQHGATTGALDSNAEFYLRSRGLDAVSARTLLTFAFAREPLLAIAHDAVREHLEVHIEQRIRAAIDGATTA